MATAHPFTTHSPVRERPGPNSPVGPGPISHKSESLESAEVGQVYGRRPGLLTQTKLTDADRTDRLTLSLLAQITPAGVDKVC